MFIIRKYSNWRVHRKDDRFTKTKKFLQMALKSQFSKLWAFPFLSMYCKRFSN